MKWQHSGWFVILVLMAVVIPSYAQEEEPGEWGLLFNMGWAGVYFPEGQPPLTGLYWVSESGDRWRPILQSEVFSEAFPDIEPWYIHLSDDARTAIVTSAPTFSFPESGEPVLEQDPYVYTVDLETSTVLDQFLVPEDAQFLVDFVAPDFNTFLYTLPDPVHEEVVAETRLFSMNVEDRKHDFLLDVNDSIDSEYILDIYNLNWSPDQTHIAIGVEEATWEAPYEFDRQLRENYTFYDSSIILYNIETEETTVINHPDLSFEDIAWMGTEKLVAICAIVDDGFYTFLEVCEIDIVTLSVTPIGRSFIDFPGNNGPLSITAKPDGTLAISRTYRDASIGGGDLYVYPPGERYPINVFDMNVGLVYTPRWYYLVED